jgi:hypothetical protein
VIKEHHISLPTAKRIGKLPEQQDAKIPRRLTDDAPIYNRQALEGRTGNRLVAQFEDYRTLLNPPNHHSGRAVSELNEDYIRLRFITEGFHASDISSNVRVRDSKRFVALHLLPYRTNSLDFIEAFSSDYFAIIAKLCIRTYDHILCSFSCYAICFTTASAA